VKVQKALLRAEVTQEAVSACHSFEMHGRQKGREGRLRLGITGKRKKLNHLMGDRRGEEAL
jgi:hypothetical protein